MKSRCFCLPPLAGALSDLAYFRKQNPSARLLASLGGDAVGAAAFAGLAVGSSARLANLTSSINGLYRDGVIDGVEIDWEWPSGSGDKEDRDKLVKYARVSRGWSFMIGRVRSVEICDKKIHMAGTGAGNFMPICFGFGCFAIGLYPRDRYVPFHFCFFCHYKSEPEKTK